jgi:hypothetical protein
MGAAAYLVAWVDQYGHGRIVDVGIYSEQSPTIAIASDKRTLCLMTVHSRYEPGQGGFGRAQRRMRDIIARTPDLRWVYGMRTYRLMQLRHAEDLARAAA